MLQLLMKMSNHLLNEQNIKCLSFKDKSTGLLIIFRIFFSTQIIAKKQNTVIYTYQTHLIDYKSLKQIALACQTNSSSKPTTLQSNAAASKNVAIVQNLNLFIRTALRKLMKQTKINFNNSRLQHVFGSTFRLSLSFLS